MNTKILKDLNFAGLIAEAEAVSEAGKEMMKNYKGYLFTNPSTCGLVNGFVREAQKYGFDTGVQSVLTNVLKFINENNISWKLASACESISNNNSSYSYIAKTGIEQVEKLLEMNESDVKSYIKAGVLKGVQYIPEFRAICKEVYNSSVTESHAPNYNVTTPISYVYENEGSKYFNVLGKTYKISNGSVKEAVCDDVNFKKVNALLESFKVVDDTLVYEWAVAAKKYSVAIAENENEENIITINANGVTESFDNSQDYREHCDALSRTMVMNEKLNFLNITNAIREVYEAYGDVYAMDCAKVLESSNGAVCAIIEAGDNVNVTVFRSLNHGTSCQSYDFMAEALKDVVKVSGVDLKHLYENRINDDVQKADPALYNNIQEELKASKDAQMELRKKKIAMLAEANKNNPAVIAVLNKAARDLALLDA